MTLVEPEMSKKSVGVKRVWVSSFASANDELKEYAGYCSGENNVRSNNPGRLGK
jgi:hypothetical protein